MVINYNNHDKPIIKDPRKILVFSLVPLPSGPLKKLIIIKFQQSWWKAYLQIVIIIKDLKNSRVLKNWEMLKTEVNTLVKKGMQSTMISKKKARIFKNQNNFFYFKIVHRIVWGGVISHCCCQTYL